MTPIIRRASARDVDALTELRLALLLESGHVADRAQKELIRLATRDYLAAKIPAEEFLVWVAEVDGCIISTSGLIFSQKPPAETNLSGKEAYVLNMYTVPEWRGRGLATRLLQELIAFVRTTDAHRIWMYATADGQPIYAKAGFVPKQRHTLEMELAW